MTIPCQYYSYFILAAAYTTVLQNQNRCTYDASCMVLYNFFEERSRAAFGAIRKAPSPLSPLSARGRVPSQVQVVPAGRPGGPSSRQPAQVPFRASVYTARTLKCHDHTISITPRCQIISPQEPARRNTEGKGAKIWPITPNIAGRHGRHCARGGVMFCTLIITFQIALRFSVSFLKTHQIQFS